MPENSRAHFLQGTARAAVAFGLAAVLAFVAGCGALPERPARSTLYDFGPGALAASGAETAVVRRAPITLAEVETNARLDGSQVLYRLGYADANELRPYSRARWSLSPAQLLRRRLWEGLSAHRLVLDPQESASISRAPGQTPDTLRLTLEEFSHYFQSPSASVGLVRARATLVQSLPGGDRILGQRVFTVERPAPTANAAGGVKALAAASDALVVEVLQWVDQPR